MEKVKAASHRSEQSRAAYARRIGLLLLTRWYLLTVFWGAHSELHHCLKVLVLTRAEIINTFLRIQFGQA